jgi:signal peptidase I
LTSVDVRPPRLRARSLVLAATVVLAPLFTVFFVAEPVRVSSGSMAPTYRTGDEVLLAKWVGPAERRDIVVLRQPDTGDLVIKRVAATAGDTVGIRDGRLFVDKALVPEPYLEHARVDGTWFGPVRVPDDSVFVLGDNRSDSVDSRSYGVVPEDAVVGRVVLRLW